jgi:hypothetical protein
MFEVIAGLDILEVIAMFELLNIFEDLLDIFDV